VTLFDAPELKRYDSGERVDVRRQRCPERFATSFALPMYARCSRRPRLMHGG